MTTVISGNLGGDPELRFTKNGVAFSKMRVAVTERKKLADGSWADGDTTWLDVTAWGTLAENITESLVKGSRVVVVGKLKQRTFERADGTNGTAMELEASDVGPSLTNQSARLAKATPKNKLERGMATIGATMEDLGIDPWAAPAQAESAPF